MDLSFHLTILTVILINAIQPTNEEMTETVRVPQIVRVMQTVIAIAPIVNYLVIITLCLTLYQKLSILLINYQYESFNTVGKLIGYGVEVISSMALLYFYISFFNVNSIYRISVSLYTAVSFWAIYKSVVDILKYINFI